MKNARDGRKGNDSKRGSGSSASSGSGKSRTSGSVQTTDDGKVIGRFGNLSSPTNYNEERSPRQNFQSGRRSQNVGPNNGVKNFRVTAGRNREKNNSGFDLDSPENFISSINGTRDYPGSEDGNTANITNGIKSAQKEPVSTRDAKTYTGPAKISPNDRAKTTPCPANYRYNVDTDEFVLSRQEFVDLVGPAKTCNIDKLLCCGPTSLCCLNGNDNGCRTTSCCNVVQRADPCCPSPRSCCISKKVCDTTEPCCKPRGCCSRCRRVICCCPKRDSVIPGNGWWDCRNCCTPEERQACYDRKRECCSPRQDPCKRKGCCEICRRKICCCPKRSCADSNPCDPFRSRHTCSQRQVCCTRSRLCFDNGQTTQGSCECKDRCTDSCSYSSAYQDCCGAPMQVVPILIPTSPPCPQPCVQVPQYATVVCAPKTSCPLMTCPSTGEPQSPEVNCQPQSQCCYSPSQAFVPEFVVTCSPAQPQPTSQNICPSPPAMPNFSCPAPNPAVCCTQQPKPESVCSESAISESSATTSSDGSSYGRHTGGWPSPAFVLIASTVTAGGTPAPAYGFPTGFPYQPILQNPGCARQQVPAPLAFMPGPVPMSRPKSS